MRQMKIVLLTGVFAFFLSACGGGGSSSETPVSEIPAQTELVTISDQNVDVAVASAVSSISDALDIEDVPVLSTTSSVAKSSVLMAQYAKTVSSDFPLSSAVSQTVECSGGGTVTADGDEATGGTVTFNECIESGVTIDGAMTLTIDGSNYTVEFINLMIQMNEMIAYYEYASMQFNETGTDLSVTITGYSEDGSERVDFKEYSVSVTGDSFSVNGYVKTNCLGAWIEVKTTQALVVTGYCPNAGEISILGNNTEVSVVFNADESVTVYLNGEAYASYPTCDSLPSLDAGCS
jgi:hypothetical protein